MASADTHQGNEHRVVDEHSVTVNGAPRALDGTDPSTTTLDWLRALGIEARTEALAEFAPQHRQALIRARDRLTSPAEMGELFKVMGLAAPDWPVGVGFEVGP